jgi:uncharacterized delta-60 repeat protein
MKRLSLIPMLFAMACGDDSPPNNPDVDAPVQPDAPEPDAPPEPFVAPTPFGVPLSQAGEDQLMAAAAAPGGGFYAAGFAAQAIGGPKSVVVVKMTTTGPDNTFGTMGVAITPMIFIGGLDDIDLAVQADGKVLVSATVADATPPVAGDRDVAVARLNADGTLDATFGTAGVATISVGEAIDDNGTVRGQDSARGLAVDATGLIYVHAASRGDGDRTAGGPRIDTDFTVIRLTAAGAIDPTWATATNNRFKLDIQETNATVRFIKALPGGGILAGGYAVTPISMQTGTGPQAVIYRLTSTGTLDPAWTTNPFHESVLSTQTEVYNVAVHDNGTFTTAGYGRDSGERNDYISLKFDLATGVRDTSFGGAIGGAVVFDPDGLMLGSNCRNAIALPGGKTVMIGSTGPGNMPAQNAVVAILTADGELDTAYGDGVHVYELGANGNDQFWGGVVSGDNFLAVGLKGGGPSPQTADVNDDSFGVIFPIK